MPGLLRGVARTAVVAGTATAVSNRVSRRQARRWGAQAAYDERFDEPAPPEPAADPVQRLTELADLHARGVLTDAEFATAKSRLLQH